MAKRVRNQEVDLREAAARKAVTRVFDQKMLDRIESDARDGVSWTFLAERIGVNPRTLRQLLAQRKSA